jgi:hypothetical protein
MMGTYVDDLCYTIIADNLIGSPNSHVNNMTSVSVYSIRSMEYPYCKRNTVPAVPVQLTWKILD